MFSPISLHFFVSSLVSYARLGAYHPFIFFGCKKAMKDLRLMVKGLVAGIRSLGVWIGGYGMASWISWHHSGGEKSTNWGDIYLTITRVYRG